MSAGAALRGLQEWCRRQTDGYSGVTITNMTTSFRDGLAFCAIIHRHRPDLIDFNSLKTEDVLKNNHLAFTVAEEKLGIPALLDAEDMVAMRVPDRLSVITYVSQYYNYFNGRPAIGGATKRPPGPAEAEPSTKKPVPSASADKENVFKGNAAGAQRHSPARARRGGFLAPIGERSPATTSQEPPAVAVAAAQGSTCTMCGLRVHLVQRHLADGRLYHRNCFRCKECSNTLMPGTYKEGKEPGTYVCQHHRTRSIIATTTLAASTGANATTASTTAGTTAGTTTTTSSSTSFLLSRLTSPSTTHSVTQDRDVPTSGKSNTNAATSPVSYSSALSGKDGGNATSPSPAMLHLAVSPTPQNRATREARNTFFLSTPASKQTTPGWDRLEPKSSDGGGSITPTANQTGTPASSGLDKNRNVEREKALENARRVLAKRLNVDQNALVVPTSNNPSPTSGKLSPTSGKLSPTSGKPSPTSAKLSPTSGKRSAASGNLSPIAPKTPTVTPAGPTPTPLPRRNISEITPSRWDSPVSPVPKYTPSTTPEKPPSLGTQFTASTGGTSAGGKSEIGSSTGTGRTPATSLCESSVKTPSSIYGGLVLRKTGTPEQPTGFPGKSPTSDSGASTFGVKLRPTKLSIPFGDMATTTTTSSTSSYTTTPTSTKLTISSTTTPGSTIFSPASSKTHSITVTVTTPDPEQPRSVVGGDHRSTAQWEVPVSPPHAETAQWEVPVSPPHAEHRGSALFGHGDTKGHGRSPSRSPETPKKNFGKKNPAPGYGYPLKRTPRRKPDTYMAPEKIQEELNSICRNLDELQQSGVLLEEELRGSEGGDGEDELLVRWFRLIQEKNMLVRRESELAYISKQQILEEHYAEVEEQLRQLMRQPERERSEQERAREEALLEELVQIVHDRNLIVENLDRDRLREIDEDKALEDMLNTKDIFKTQETKVMGQETPKDAEKETPKEKRERQKAEQERKEVEKKEKLRADKERREQEKQEKQRAEKEQREKEKQQRQAEKERKEKEKQEKAKREKEKQEKEKQEKEKSKKNKEKTENKKNKGDTLAGEMENGKIAA